MRRGSFTGIASGGSPNEPLIVVEETGGIAEEEEDEDSKPSPADNFSINQYLLTPWRDTRKRSLPTPPCTSGITASQVKCSVLARHQDRMLNPNWYPAQVVISDRYEAVANFKSALLRTRGLSGENVIFRWRMDSPRLRISWRFALVRFTLFTRSDKLTRSQRLRTFMTLMLNIAHKSGKSRISDDNERKRE